MGQCVNVCFVIAAGATSVESAVPVSPIIGFASAIGAVSPTS